MEISKSNPASTSWNLDGILARREMPFDTRRSERSTSLPSDTFRPSLRTPLDADRILASRTASTPALLGADEDSGKDGKEMRDPMAGKRSEASGEARDTSPEDAKGGSGPEGDLTEEEKAQVAELKRRDAEVRAHEQAHLAASGGMARGGASYDFQKGPDGRSYAVGGEVQIAMKSGRTPEETIRNAEQVRAAALAPADPSGVDQQTAAAAARMAQEARQELSARALDAGSKDGDAGRNGTGREDGKSADRSAAADGKSSIVDTSDVPAAPSPSATTRDATESSPAIAAPKSYSLASEREKDGSRN